MNEDVAFTLKITKLEITADGLRLFYHYQLDDHEIVGGDMAVGDTITVMRHEIKGL